MSEGSNARQTEGQAMEEKKPERTIADLPSYKGDLSKLPKIRKVKIITHDQERYHIIFRHEDWDWSLDITNLSEHNRNRLASLFNIEIKKTLCNIRAFLQFGYRFALYNVEGEVIVVCRDAINNVKELRGEIFCCSVPNYMALTQKLLNSKDFGLCDNSLYS